MKDYSDLYKAFKSKRVERGYSITQIANILGKHRTNFSKFEKGKFRPSIELLSRMMTLLEFSMRDIEEAKGIILKEKDKTIESTSQKLKDSNYVNVSSFYSTKIKAIYRENDNVTIKFMDYIDGVENPICNVTIPIKTLNNFINESNRSFKI